MGSMGNSRELKLLGRIKKEPSKNKSNPFRFRHAGRVDKFFLTLSEAQEFQFNYSQAKAKVGVDTAKLFEDPKLIKASERAYTLLREKGIEDPEVLVDAVKSYINTMPPQGFNTTLSEAVTALQSNPDYLDKAATTKRDYDHYSNHILSFFGSDKNFSSISSRDWQNYLNDCRKTSNHAYNKALRHARLFYGRYWMPMGYAAENPLTEGSMAPKPAKHAAKMKNIYSCKEIEAIKAIASDDISEQGQRDYLAFIVQAYTGIRGEEMEKLTFGMFCDRNSSFQIRPTRLKMTLPSSITKKGEYRQVEVCTKLRQELLLLPYFNKHLRPVTEKNEDTEPSYGFHMNEAVKNTRCFSVKILQFRRALERWCKLANVEYKENSLRATYTSHAHHGLFRDEPNPDQALQRSLGHRLGSTVTEHNYFHQVDPEDAVAYFANDDTWAAFSDLMETHFT